MMLREREQALEAIPSHCLLRTSTDTVLSAGFRSSLCPSMQLHGKSHIRSEPFRYHERAG